MKKFLSMFFLLFAFSVSASSINIAKINTLIKKNNLNWIAKSNSFTELNDIEIKRLLGSNELPTGNGLFEDRNLAIDSIDWRNNNGKNWLGPVMNQGNCGSCVAFAAVATLEATYRINSGLEWLMPTFSPQQLFSCGGGACDWGWRPSSAASMLKSKGIVDEACAPYESGSTGEDIQCKNTFCNNQKARTYRILDSSSPSFNGGSASKVKEALKKGPLMTTLMVYEDFVTYSSGIYTSVGTQVIGGHAVSLVGFNDVGRYWIVRNSWGSNWGENGFIRISYDDKCGIGENTWAFRTTPEDNYISIQSPLNHEYISGEKTIQVALSKAGPTKVIVNGDTDKINSVACPENTTSCSLSVDTTRLKDGRYEVFATTGSKQSQVREFLILNNEPQSTISFAGIRGVDLSKPQSGRIEFNIDVKSNPVIPQKVIFYLVDKEGKILIQRVTDQVVPSMRLGLRTNAVPNGVYSIYFTAETPFQGKMVIATSNKEIITTIN